VFAFMLIAFLVVLGIFSFKDLGVDLFPQTDTANIYTQVSLPGASPEEMVSQVVLPLEEAIAASSGIEELRSQVNEGNASVQVQFTLDRNINEAADEAREKVQGAVRRMPQNASQPLVRKQEVDRDPVAMIALMGPRSIRELTEIADKTVRRAIETVDGVAQITIQGTRARQVQVYLDINKLNAYNLTAQNVSQAIQSENIEAAGGRMIRGQSQLGVRTLGRVTSVEAFNNIIIKDQGNAPVRIRDVGYAQDGEEEKKNFVYINGEPAVLLQVARQSGSNTVEVVDGVLARLPQIQKNLPSGIKLKVVRETAQYIRASVEALEEHLIIGSLLAAVVVFLFFRDWRTVLISSLAIPTSIITAFTLMRAMGFTLNSMTLLGLTLAVGIVIDDAIIVLENIYRHLVEEGMDGKEAAIRGTREISLAVVATTFSLVIIFVPIAFMTGYAKRFLNQFGWTMAMAVMVSMLVAFTLTPTLSARLLKAKGGAGHGHKATWWENAYTRLLSWSLDRRWAVMAVAAAILATTPYAYRTVGRDWMPQEDQSELQVNVEAPLGSAVEVIERIVLGACKTLLTVPGVNTCMATTNNNNNSQGNAQLLLDPPDKRAPIEAMGELVREAMRPFAANRPRVTFPNALGGRDNFAAIRIQILGPEMAKAVDIARVAQIELQKEEAIRDPRANLSLANPELHVVIDRQLASDQGVRVSDVANTVRLLMSGDDQVSTFKDGGEQYPVTMRLMPGQRDDPEVVARLLVPSSRSGLVRLDSVAHLERGSSPARIERFARQFSVGLFGNTAPGHSLDEAAAAAERALSRVEMPFGYTYVFSGQTQVLEETTRNMLIAMGLASIFMYMVLAAQFESLIHPFIILTALPLSIPFALLSLNLTGRTLNLFSALGVLLLLGIVKKNGILQIDYMNQLRQTGMGLREAILQANRVRLRPILMTTMSIIAGLIPTAMGIGVGASQRSAIAVTIIGGQSLCLLLTLVVVPVLYSLTEEATAWVRARRGVPEPVRVATGD
jgi:hydrophobic/amphiphilic exporter-1 (mainly G- bacteria), HAE1 family